MRRFAPMVLLAALASAALAQDAATLKKYEADYVKAKKAFAAKPKDAKVKATYVASTNRFATATMTAPDLGPRQKYPVALRLYREVLKVDPKNKEASNNSQMIIDIYKSMGRPVPN